MKSESRIFAIILTLTLIAGSGLVPLVAEALALTPVITAPANNSQITVNTPTTFTASATGGNAPYAFTWSFGDGTGAFGPSFAKIYTQTGARAVSMTVTDFSGQRATATINLIVNNPVSTALTAVITAPANNSQITVNTPTTFTASATGGNAPYAFTWSFGDGTGASGVSFNKTYSALGAKTVILTVTDFLGQTDTATIALSVIGGTTTDTTPPSTPTIISSSHGVGATSTATTVNITWTASTDDVALAGYSFLWDNNPTTIPDNIVENANTALTQTLAVGTWWFHIKALDAAGNASGITHYGPIMITGSTADPLTITNIRVTDITQTSGIIRWTTNRPANSRVIYDSVSHPDISSQTAPNFGYAFSTETFDNNPKVTEHAVTVSGLATATQYFFRVISQE